MSLNSIAIYGTLVRDPEAETLANGTALTKFSIAVNEKFSVQGEARERVHYFDVTVWGKQAENCAKYLEKGRHVNVQGRLAQDRWEDKETGKGRSKVHIVANDVQFLSSGKQSSGDGGARRGDEGYGGSGSEGSGTYGSGSGNLPPLPAADDDDIPF